MTTLNPQRTIDELRELRSLTGDANGAQRLCWTPTWARARAWFKQKLDALPIQVETDEAGNLWATLPGRSAQTLVMGSHLDSVTNGGWLDGSLGVLGGLEVLRRIASEGTPPVTVRLVDWADEEGARFATGCFGSGMATGHRDASALRHLTDADGRRKEDVLREHGVDLGRAHLAARHLQNVAAYLELHIEQGPALEGLNLPLGVVTGTFGIEKHLITFDGLASHAGATPMTHRHDAFLAAARFSLAAREIAIQHGGVTTTGRIFNTPNQSSVIAGQTALVIDQRVFDEAALVAMLRDAKAVCEHICLQEKVSATWQNVMRVDVARFDPHLQKLGDEAVREVCGMSHHLPSGALHDASEVARFGVPTVMLFAQSLRGLSHNKDEDTREEHLALAVSALDKLASKTIAWLAQK